MEVFVLILRLALASIFGVAGIAKLFDPAGSEKAFEDFGVPKFLAKPMVILLPTFELVIAGLLLFVSTSWFGAIGAAGLFVVFTAAMLYQMAKGNAPDCHCFGQIHSEPVGVTSVGRNILFLMLAGFLIMQGRASQGLGLVSSNQDVMQLVIGVAVVVLLLSAVLFLKKISEQQTQIMRRIELMELVARDGGAVTREDAGHPNEGMPIGAVVPNFDLPDLDGETVSLSTLLADKIPVLFLFVSPTCSPCKALVPEFDAWQKDLAGKINFVFISNGDTAENREKFDGDHSNLVLLQKNREITDLLRAKWTPTALLMDTDGRVESHAAAGDSAIRELVGKLLTDDPINRYSYFTNSNSNSHSIKIGESVPDVSAADLSGTAIGSDYFKGKPTLVTFWSTTCPHCVNMLDDLRSWDSSKGADEPNLIVFSDGDQEELKTLGLKSPIIYDEGHKTAAGFGMFGTPSAVLVNEEGKFVTETAVGAPDIWSLIGKRKIDL